MSCVHYISVDCSVVYYFIATVIALLLALPELNLALGEAR
jgi:hypothetical protein